MSLDVAIVDYGMGNLRSVYNAFTHVAPELRIAITSDANAVHEARRVVVPGQSAMPDTMHALNASGLRDAVVAAADEKPFLGICLGLQMLFDVGYEDGEHRGLGVLRGRCVRFDVDQTMNLKVPHMGWNQLSIKRQSPILRDLSDQSCVYFVHGYHVEPGDESVIATTTDYGRPFVSSIWRDNLMATQFHPEKSQKVGLQMLANFAAM